MRLMGVDYGRRRIGVAVTDQTASLVRGLAALDTRRETDTVGAVCSLAQQQDVSTIVVGLPLGPDEEETAMSGEVRAFAHKVSERSGLNIRFVEESFSSRKAQALLSSRSKKKRRDKASNDRLAACLILEQYLRER